MQAVEALISKHQQAIDKIDAEIEEAEDAAGLAPPSAALLSKKQRALELHIKLAQDQIRRVELQLRIAATAEEKAMLQQEKAMLQQEKAMLQQEKILLLQAQERAQQPSASGEFERNWGLRAAKGCRCGLCRPYRDVRILTRLLPAACVCACFSSRAVRALRAAPGARR
jgi:hypothetical protein